METPFVINPEAPQGDLSYELNNHLDELKETLFVLGGCSPYTIHTRSRYIGN